MAHIELICVSEAKSPDGKIWKFPFAFPVIIRQLQKTKHTFNVIDTHLHKKSFEEVIDIARKSNSRIFGISAFSHNYASVKAMAEGIRKAHKDALIIVGGLLARNDNVLMGRTEVDIAVTGAEGEFILPEILDAYDSGTSLEKVKGLTYRDRTTKRIVHTGFRPLMTDEQYQDLEMPAYEYFDKEIRELVANIAFRTDFPVKAFPLLTMRGCPFRCTFCGQLYGRRFFKRSWSKYFDEIEFLQKRYGIEGFYKYDQNMFLSEKDVDEYCSEYDKRGCNAKMLVALRPTFGNYDMFKKLKEHGVVTVLFGLESGSQYMLDRMRKKFNYLRMKKIIKSAMDAGLMIHGNFIFGTPGETEKTIGETREFMMLIERWIFDQRKKFELEGKMCTSGYGWSILIPSPTSELYDLAVKKGLIEDEEQYLLSLGTNEAFKLVAGSHFKIALAEVGGGVNMSDFPSVGALINYVRFSLNWVKFKAQFFDHTDLLKSHSRTVSLLYNSVKYFIEYLIETFKASGSGKVIRR